MLVREPPRSRDEIAGWGSSEEAAMRGERQQERGARLAHEAQAKRVREDSVWQQQVLQPVWIGPVCTCDFQRYPHDLSDFDEPTKARHRRWLEPK